MKRWRRGSAAVAVAFLWACGDGVSPSDASGPGAPVDDTMDPNVGALMCTPSGVTSGWTFSRLGVGIKPALAVGSDGTVHSAFMSEAQEGWTRYAQLGAGSQAVSSLATISEGYFYGPLDLVLDGARSWVLYHDHDREDQVLAARVGSDWSLHPMPNSGHDGWYNAGTVGSGGALLTASYDPSGFGGVGVIYGVWDGSDWAIELAAAGSFDYTGGMAVVQTPDGSVHIAFFDDVAGEVKLATLAGVDWTVATVEPNEDALDVGYFPDMVVDPDGSTLHMVYLERATTSTGVIRYARGAPGAFEMMDVVEVTDFSGGARDVGTLDLDASGRPVIATQTKSEFTVMRLVDGAVQPIASFPAAEGITFGHQTEIEIDVQGRTHIVWWQSGEDPGTVCHAVSG